MAKTLNQFIEGYLKVKNPDEQKFVDKHVVAKHSDRNGNDDAAFKGKTKQIDRRKERHGYNPGEDEKVYEELKGNQHKIDANKNGKIDAQDFKHLRKKKDSGKWKSTSYKTPDGKWASRDVKEEVEELDELSKGTLNSYLDKTKSQKTGKNVANVNDKNSMRKYTNRVVGGARAARKISQKVKEEVELEEKLSAKSSMGTYIKDFQKSDAPQFKGKSQEKRRAMAIAAKLTAERGGKALRKEEKLANLLDDLAENDRRTMLSVFDKLNEDNQNKFLEACETPEGVELMLDFAISHRGE
jgi:hypothetical protein